MAPGDLTRPDWAAGMTDLHVHAWPSLLPRHGDDRSTVVAEQAQGFATVVLKAHEGSTVERAAIANSALAGTGTDSGAAAHNEAQVYGGVVLNSPVGGANPDAVEVAARLGGRVVWMPTVSARNHQAGAASSELAVHRGFELRPVDVVQDGRLRPEWFDVLDAVARHDLLLASGHLSAAETVVLFSEARRRGVGRLLMNHPKMAFLHWSDRLADDLRALGAHLELGILPDLLGGPENSSLTLLDVYPAPLLVFGGDLGHAGYATPAQIVPPWLRELEQRAGARAAETIMTANSRNLLQR